MHNPLNAWRAKTRAAGAEDADPQAGRAPVAEAVKTAGNTLDRAEQLAAALRETAEHLAEALATAANPDATDAQIEAQVVDATEEADQAAEQRPRGRRQPGSPPRPAPRKRTRAEEMAGQAETAQADAEAARADASSARAELRDRIIEHEAARQAIRQEADQAITEHAARPTSASPAAEADKAAGQARRRRAAREPGRGGRRGSDRARPGPRRRLSSAPPTTPLATKPSAQAAQADQRAAAAEARAEDARAETTRAREDAAREVDQLRADDERERDEILARLTDTATRLSEVTRRTPPRSSASVPTRPESGRSCAARWNPAPRCSRSHAASCAAAPSAPSVTLTPRGPSWPGRARKAVAQTPRAHRGGAAAGSPTRRAER